MSAQAGIFYFDERPIDPAMPARLDAQLARFGPDGGGRHVGPGLVMVHRSLHVTPEDYDERQPHVSERGLVMTWDGRLDNRDDLLLQLWRTVRDDMTDIALAMAAYQQWGEAALGRLVGEWSLAVADPHARTITLASDFSGVCPLYVHEAPDHVAWSTSLTVLLDLTHTTELDPRFLVGCITFAAYPQATAYRDVRFVAAGQAERWDANGRWTRTAFWTPAVPPVRYAKPADYTDRLRTLLADAVRTRMRATRPVWIELSGGWDSSSIACLADAMCRSGRALCGMQTISYTSDAVRASDERPFIEAVEQQIGATGRHLRLEDVCDLEDDEGPIVTPTHPSGTSLAFLRCVRDSGSHVLLSGSPGDLVMGNLVDASAAVLEDLADGSPLRALANLREWSRYSQQPIWTLAANLRRLYGSRDAVIARQLAQTLQRHGGSAPKGDLLSAACELFLLTRHGAELWRENMIAAFGATLDSGHAAKREIVRGLLSAARSRPYASGSELARARRSHPYMHRPLLELVLGIPLGVLCRPGQPRALMREALAPILPDRILRRRSKGYIAPFQDRMLRSVVPDLLRRPLETWRLVQAGLLDPDRLRARLEAHRQGASRDVGNLLPVVRFERWAHRLNATARAAIPQ